MPDSLHETCDLRRELRSIDERTVWELGVAAAVEASYPGGVHGADQVAVGQLGPPAIRDLGLYLSVAQGASRAH